MDGWLAVVAGAFSASGVAVVGAGVAVLGGSSLQHRGVESLYESLAMTLAGAPDARIGSDRRVATKLAAEDTSRVPARTR